MRQIGALIVLLGIVLGLAPTARVAAAEPPGGWIAYQGEGRTLRLIRADGGGERTLPTRGEAYTPRWSPLGGELVYSDELPEAPYRGQLVAINPESGASRVVVAAEARDPELESYWSYAQPRWTPDGGAIVYIRVGGGRVTTIMRVAASGGAPTELFYGASTTRFDLSPLDGRFVVSEDAFAEERVQGSLLTVRDADGGNARVLLPRGGAFYFQPTWTPDGTAVVVRRQAARDSTTATLVLIEVASGRQRTLGTVAAGSSFAFSPDGAWLALASGDTRRLAVVELGLFTEGPAIGQGAAPSWEPRVTSRFFPLTGLRAAGRFLTYWEAHGGMPIYGNPLTEELREELSPGKFYTVQYFERARFELHPENSDPRYQVLLGQFGRRIHPADPPVPAREGATYLAETGHNLEGRFLAYWREHGDVPIFGYPISEEFVETLEDRQPHTVQYFERARLELHTDEKTGEPIVLLGQFGRRILEERAR